MFQGKDTLGNYGAISKSITSNIHHLFVERIFKISSSYLQFMMNCIQSSYCSIVCWDTSFFPSLPCFPPALARWSRLALNLENLLHKAAGIAFHCIAPHPACSSIWQHCYTGSLICPRLSLSAQGAAIISVSISMALAVLESTQVRTDSTCLSVPHYKPLWLLSFYSYSESDWVYRPHFLFCKLILNFMYTNTVYILNSTIVEWFSITFKRTECYRISSVTSQYSLWLHWWSTELKASPSFTITDTCWILLECRNVSCYFNTVKVELTHLLWGTRK